MRALESDHSIEPLQVSRPGAENFRLPQAVDMAGSISVSPRHVGYRRDCDC